MTAGNIETPHREVMTIFERSHSGRHEQQEPISTVADFIDAASTISFRLLKLILHERFVCRPVVCGLGWPHLYSFLATGTRRIRVATLPFIFSGRGAVEASKATISPPRSKE
jgi:hypothetical protein